MKNNESMEMYLETIYRLSQTGATVHSIDVAKELNYSKPSVSRAMKLLVGANYILFHTDGRIELTAEGVKKAQNIFERHCVLTRMLEEIGAPKEMAEENACRIEHFISEDLFKIIKEKYGD